MSTTKIITIICWLITALILIGLVVFFLTGSIFRIGAGLNIHFPTFHIGGFENLTGPYKEINTYTVPADGLDSITVDWTAGEIGVTAYDGDTVKLTEYARRDLQDNEKLVYNVSGGKLEIMYHTRGLTFGMPEKKLELLVPQPLAEKMNLLRVNCTSAGLKVSGFNVQTLDIGETSGAADISDINSVTAEVHSISGTITITGLTASALTMRTVSGEISLTDVAADTLKTNTTSGGQNLFGSFKSVEAGSVSGEISVTSGIIPEKMRFGTTSGDIAVTLPEGSDYTVSYSSVSGDFRSEVPVRTVGSAPYVFSTVSGDIDLKAA